MTSLARIFAAAVLLFVCADAIAAKRANFGGTNHFLYAYGTTDGTNPNNTWYTPANNLRTPVGQYHLAPKLVSSQIYSMKASGQTDRGCLRHQSRATSIARRLIAPIRPGNGVESSPASR